MSYDPYEMAAACKEHELKVVGHCTDVMPKHSLIDSSVVQDIGICAEYEKSGEKIWCHWSTKEVPAFQLGTAAPGRKGVS